MSPDVVDHLYGLPLEEFTPQRDLAARELRRAGDRDAAGQLAKLPKPTPAAWTANQLAREQPDLLEELLEAGEALRRAQEEALSGGSGQVLRDAMAAQRRAVDAIMSAAQTYKPAGRALSRAMADRLRTTLQAAAGDEGLTAALAAGRLVDEAQQGGAWPLGFEVPAGGGKTAGGRGGGAKKAAAKRGRARTATDDEAGGAKQAAAKRRGGEAKAEDDEAAARAAEEAAAQAERERAEREALEAELRQARGNLRVRERAVAAAEREAEEARVAARAAAERLEAARQAVEDSEAEADAATRAADEAAELLQKVRDEVARLEERLD
jgi:hypothetical protein